MRRCGLGFLTGLFLCQSALAADLKALPRHIGRPPVLQTKAPKYCLLVFGAAAATRVWLVFDGDVLYVDRNGNGDLSEAGERFRPRQPLKEAADFREFVVGDLVEKDGKTRHRDLTVTRFGRTSHHGKIALTAAGRGEQVAGQDGSGALRFADRPEDAPVVHFNGPLTLALPSGNTFRAGAKAKPLYACVGTPGLGEGTLAVLQQDAIPEDVHPVAELRLPGQQPLRVPLAERC